MPDTLYIKLDAVDVRPLEDGLLAIFNNEQTDARRYFELVSLRVSPSAPISNNTAGVGRSAMMSIRRITALSGGDAVTPIQLDTANAALPAQILIRNNPDSVTATDTFRRINDAPAYSLTAANTQLSSRTYGGSMVTHQKSHYADIWRGGENANVDSIILRAGEGLALFQEQYGTQHSMQTAAVVTNIATNASYICRSVDLSTDRRLGEPNFAIFNGSGSGVTLAVKLWVLPMDGEAVMIPPLRLCRVAGIAMGGDAVTPLRPDTSKTAPSALQVLSGPFQPRISGGWQADYYTTHGTAYAVVGAAAGIAWGKAQIDAGTFSRAVMTQNFRAIGETPSGIRVGTMDDDLMFSAKAGEGIVIKPGDGLALVAGREVVSTGGVGTGQAVGNTSTFINFDIEATILHYPPPSGGGTYPAVGDVDFGVTYGPNGNDFTGTLVQPAVTDVKTGVQYGAGGIEFTGTYSGGGGGGTYPLVGDVDFGVTYGPTGVEYTGTLVQPSASDVKSGVTYGAGGTEFTGTLVGGGGSSAYFRRR